MLNDKFFLLSLYSFYDSKNKMLQPPFSEFSQVDAVRRFDTLLKNPESLISRYKDDFSLIYLGTIDLNSGEINPDYTVICDCNDISNLI